MHYSVRFIYIFIVLDLDAKHSTSNLGVFVKITDTDTI